MTKQCASKIKFLADFKGTTPIYASFQCVKEKGHLDDHHTYGQTGETHLYWSLDWWEKEKP